MKKPVMRCFEHRFTWTGSKPPNVSSDLQEVSAIQDIVGEQTKKVELKFRATRVYNEVEIVHVRMDLDDSDGKAKPFISHTVHHPIRLISFDVELLHATKAYSGEVARLTRKAMNKGPSAIDEQVATVRFDPLTRSFAHQVLNPEPGYCYTLSWVQPGTKQNGKQQTKQPKTACAAAPVAAAAAPVTA